MNTIKRQARDYLKRNRRELEARYRVSPWRTRRWYYCQAALPGPVATEIARELGVEIDELGLRVRLLIGNGQTIKHQVRQSTLETVATWRAMYDMCGSDIPETARQLGKSREIISWVCGG